MGLRLDVSIKRMCFFFFVCNGVENCCGVEM